MEVVGECDWETAVAQGRTQSHQTPRVCVHPPRVCGGPGGVADLGVIVFTTEDSFFGIDSQYGKLVAFMIIEHVLFGMKFVSGRMISDVPSKVMDALERQVSRP